MIYSINAYQDFDYLCTQLSTIKYFSESKASVIINFSRRMHQKSLSNKLFNQTCDLLNDENFVVKRNPRPIDKKRFHGSLFKGIMENMFFTEYYDFEYFISLSARTFPIQKLSPRIIKGCENGIIHNYEFPEDQIAPLGFFQQYLKNSGKKLNKELHEGQVITKEDTLLLIELFRNEQKLYRALCDTNTCVEEYTFSSLVKPVSLLHGTWKGYEGTESTEEILSESETSSRFIKIPFGRSRTFRCYKNLLREANSDLEPSYKLPHYLKLGKQTIYNKLVKTLTNKN
jgi:hypothetical protein